MGDTDLFSWRETYPQQPGYRRRSKTSKGAAESVKDRAPTLRDRVLWLLKTSEPGHTADECAMLLGETVLSIRPRLSELKRLGKIYDSGITRPNISGVQASVWRSY